MRFCSLSICTSSIAHLSCQTLTAISVLILFHVDMRAQKSVFGSSSKHLKFKAFPEATSLDPVERAREFEQVMYRNVTLTLKTEYGNFEQTIMLPDFKMLWLGSIDRLAEQIADLLLLDRIKQIRKKLTPKAKIDDQLSKRNYPSFSFQPPKRSVSSFLAKFSLRSRRFCFKQERSSEPRKRCG